MIDSISLSKSGTSNPRPTASAKEETAGYSALGFTDYLDGQITKKPVEKRPSSHSEQDAEPEEYPTPEMPEMAEVPPWEAAGSDTAEPLSAGTEGIGEARAGSHVSLASSPADEALEVPQFEPVSNALSSRSGAAGNPAVSESNMAEMLANSEQKGGMVDLLPEMMAAVAQSVSVPPVVASATKGLALDAAVSPVFEGPGVMAADGSVRMSALPGGDTPVPGSADVDEQALKFDDLVERFDRRLLSMVQQGEKVMRITVQPAAMGRLTVSCTESNSGMSLEIVAQNSGVRDVIAQQEDAIRRLMQEHSVELGHFDVLLDEGSGGQRQARGAEVQQVEQRAPRGIAPAVEQEGEPPAPRQKNKGGAVYLVA
jgi:flagellar hook-length control protein FliK